MKLFITLIGFIALVTSPGRLTAQNVSDSLQYVFTVWESEQRRTISMNLSLDEFEKSPFWAVYDSYSKTKEYLELEHLQILNLSQLHQGHFASRELYAALLENELALAKIRKKYYRKFCKVLSYERANTFMWMDETLRELFRLKLRANDPLIVISHHAEISAKGRLMH